MKKPTENDQQTKPAPQQKMSEQDCKRFGLDPTCYGYPAK